MIDLLEEGRGSIRKQLNNILAVRHEFHDCACGYKGRTTLNYIRLLYLADLLPSSRRTHETILDRIKAAQQMGNPSPAEGCKVCERRPLRAPPLYWATQPQQLQGLEDGNGLCIDCIARIGHMDSEGSCRIEHKAEPVKELRVGIKLRRI